MPEILKSENYNKFEKIIGNRTISEAKVSRIIRDVEDNKLNLFPYAPLITFEKKDGKFQIIDGQHRFEACKKLGLPIFYVVAPDIKLRDIARMNSNTDKWSNKDFMNCYIELGVEPYQTLKDFMKSYSLNYTLAIQLLMKGKVSNGSSHTMEFFRDGRFEVKCKNEAEYIIKTVDELFGKYVFYRDRNLFIATQKLIEANKWDLDIMKDKISRHHKMMEQQTTAQNYIYLLEQIYNMNARERTTIF